jgi:hypothetical protein
MAWPVQRTNGFLLDATAWNEVVAALSAWGGDVNAGAHNLSNVAVLSFGAGGYVGTSLGVNGLPAKLNSASSPHTVIARVVGALVLGNSGQGVNDDGFIQLGNGNFVSANSWNWIGAIGQNFAIKGTDNADTFYTPITHGSIGYRGMYFAGTNIVFTNAAGASTAGATVSPTAHVDLPRLRAPAPPRLGARSRRRSGSRGSVAAPQGQKL